MKSIVLRAILVTLALTLTAIAGTAQAASYLANFPSSNTFYSSATHGTGFIPPGGQSAYMWTTGDYVTQTFTGTGLNSVGALSYSFTYQNYLGNGSTETAGLLINGTQVGSFTAPDTGYSGSYPKVTGTVSFSPIVGGGTYTLSMVLENTVPPANGSIAFVDGGVWRLSSSAVPIPGALLLFGPGLVGLAAMKRRFKK